MAILNKLQKSVCAQNRHGLVSTAIFMYMCFKGVCKSEQNELSLLFLSSTLPDAERDAVGMENRISVLNSIMPLETIKKKTCQLQRPKEVLIEDMPFEAVIVIHFFPLCFVVI